ncbi:hypothetical protein OIU78_022651 [Salix suchowensis]|nr:hypothetical protein OIU78_022651 [Salix suchowensis]
METSTTLPENSSAAAGDWEDEDGDEDMRVQAEEGVQCSTGNRWPKQETLALLKIRSDMDFAFRDSVVKAPLWEKVSRKLNELGYNRSAKKCKEKFENIYKYHRRTKGGQSGRPNGKTYRFFEQLQALDKTNALVSPASSDRAHCLMPSASVNPVSFIPNIAPCSIQSPSANCTDATSTSTASTSSEESDGTRKKKQKLADFFERLMKEVVEKQENLQNKFLEAIEKCEQERIAREEAWKMQELDRIKREHELLVHERAISAAKDAAVLAFLQKFSEQGIPVQLPDNPTVPMKFPDNQTVPVQFSVSARLPKDQAVPVENAVKTHENNSLESFVNMSSSRWPKEEIESLIKIRTYLEFQCQENGPKRAAVGGDINFNEKSRLMLYTERRLGGLIIPGYELKPEELLMHMMGGQGDQQLPDSATTEDRESENVDQIQEDYRSKEDGDGYRIVAIDPSSMEIME